MAENADAYEKLHREIVYPELKTIFSPGKVRFLCHLGEDFTKFDRRLLGRHEIGFQTPYGLGFYNSFGFFFNQLITFRQALG